MKVQHKEAYIWRWLALLSVLGNIFFNYYINAYPINGQTMGDVSGKHPTLFTPEGYAFSIWGIIYLSLIIYSVYQVLPSQRNNPVLSQLAHPLIYTSLLSVMWLVSFSYEILDSSVIIILAMLVTAVVLFATVKEAYFRNSIGFWVTIPFSLYMGWLSVATITNVAVLLKDLGWTGGTWGETPWTLVMLGITAVLGIIISWRFRDLAYPLVFCWATVAIHVARQNNNNTIATAALLTALVLALWVVGYGLWLAYRSQPKTAVAK